MGLIIQYLGFSILEPWEGFRLFLIGILTTMELGYVSISYKLEGQARKWAFIYLLVSYFHFGFFRSIEAINHNNSYVYR